MLCRARRVSSIVVGSAASFDQYKPTSEESLLYRILLVEYEEYLSVWKKMVRIARSSTTGGGGAHLLGRLS